MIWQLMKRDQTWQWTPLAAIYALLYTLNQFTSDLLIIMTLGMIGWTAPAFKTYCTLYEGALPIPARNLWLSRVMSLLAGMWLPVAIACAIRAVTGGSSVVLMEAAAVYTVLVLGTKCVRLGQFAPPEWFNAIGLPIFAITGALLGAPIQRILPAPLVMAICGAASAALFVKGWTGLPKAFELAQASAAAATKSREVKLRSRFVWSPVFSSFYGWQGAFLLIVMFGQMTLGSFLFWFVVITSVQVQARARMRWLLHLPIAPGTLFAIVALPTSVAIIAGSILNIFFDTDHPLPLSTRIVEMAAQLAILYAVVIALEMFRWRRLSKLPLLVRSVPAILGCAPLVIATVLSAHNRRSILDDASGRIAAEFSGNWWLLAPAMLAGVALVYWAAQRVFAELEYPNMRITEWGK